MKPLLVALAMSALTLQPAMAASCWSSANGSHLLFPPTGLTATYAHGWTVETCDLTKLNWSSARVWCDVSSVSGVTHLISAHRRPSAADRVWWDGHYYVREDCPTE